jgi:shikimate dehydrogenase
MKAQKRYRLGLTGYPLTHSRSPQLHAAAFRSLGLEGEYRLYPILPEDQGGLSDLLNSLRKGELDGLNVTIPHKQGVIPWLDMLSPVAHSVGAVNTIFRRDGKLVGENTDVHGFWVDLEMHFSAGLGNCVQGRCTQRSQKKALVLGAGGAARAVVYALGMHGWQVIIAARHLDRAARLVQSLGQVPGIALMHFKSLEAGALEPCLDDIQLVVNATPVGMTPDINHSPWPEGLPLPRAIGVYDLVYSPVETLFLCQVRAIGLQAATGLGMLVEQAALSFEIWTGHTPSRKDMLMAVEAG